MGFDCEIQNHYNLPDIVLQQNMANNEFHGIVTLDETEYLLGLV